MAKGIVVRILGDDSDLQKTLTDSAKNVAKWGAAAAAAAAVASVAITKSTAASAREIKNLSRLIGASTSDFQKMAAGAKTVGIEQDKLADIFKDVNDKVGDFMQTGAGPLVDFFEQIAPQVGITAQEFKNLSGPEAMQKYVNALEAANVSQADMIFYMEAIASDASLLTPLLANNSAGFKKIGEEAEKAGAILSDIDIEKLNQFDQQIIAGEQAIGGMANALAVELAPQLTGVLEEFEKLAFGSEETGNTIAAVFDGIVSAAGFVGNSVRGIETAFDFLQVGASQTLATILGVAGMVSDSAAEAAEEARNAVAEHYKDMQETLNKPLPSDAFKSFVEANRAASEKLAEEVVSANEARNEAIQVQTDLELEAAMEKYANLQELEDKYQERVAANSDEFDKNKLNKAKDYAEAAEKLERASAKRKLGIASGVFGNLSSLMDTENRKLFEIGKAAALSGAIVDGYSAVLSAYDKGNEVGGPVVGAAFAATAGIATAVQISKISSASYGGGGSAAGGMASSAPSIPETQQAANSAPQQERNLVVSGIDAGSLYSGEQLLQLMDNINGAVEDGYTLKAS